MEYADDIINEGKEEEKKDFMSKVKEITGDVLKNSGLMDKMKKQIEKTSGTSEYTIKINGTSFKGNMVEITSDNPKTAVKIFIETIKNLEKEGK